MTLIEIEGIIGVPEDEQFQDPGQRVATYEKFRTAVEAIRRIDSAQVIVDIRSTGGDVNQALLILDALKSLKAQVVTRCYGYVASAATVIAQGASPGQRQLSSSALYLVHRSSAAKQGNANAMSATLQLLEMTDRRIAEVYAGASGRDAEGFFALMSENQGNGRWLSAQEALDLGLADAVIEAKDEPSQNTNSNFMNLSKRLRNLMETIGLRPDPAQENLSESDLDLLGEKLSGSQQQIADLQNRIAELEIANAKIAAKASATEAVEDPSMAAAGKSTNQSAYDMDAQSFK